MSSKSTEVPALAKMDKIFDFIRRSPAGVSQAEICADTGLPKATVSRMVHSLNEMAYLTVDSNTVYLGEKLLLLGSVTAQRMDLAGRARPVVEELRDVTSEMVKLSVMRGNIIFPLLHCESKQAIRITLDANTVFPPYIGAAGKLLLALSPEGKRYEHTVLPFISLEKHSEATITDKNALMEILETIRRDSIAYDRGEETLGIFAVAAPVYGNDGSVLAALSMPFFGDFEEKIIQYRPLIQQYAMRISQLMGYRPAEEHYDQ